MAHEVSAKIHTKVVAHKDLEIVVKKSSTGRLGTLLISKGNIEWLPSGNSVNKKSMTWSAFAKLMQEHGKGKKIKKVTKVVKKAVKKVAKKPLPPAK